MKEMTFERWMESVEKTKETGYAVDEGTFMLGVSILAVPVIDNDRMIYSLVAIGLRDQFVHLGYENVLAEMRKVAAELADVAAKTM